jgi:hypothetical protein
MSQFYLPQAESEWLKAQEKGYLLGLVRREMAGGEPPSGQSENQRFADWLSKQPFEDKPFVAVKPKLLSGSELFHPKPQE